MVARSAGRQRTDSSEDDSHSEDQEEEEENAPMTTPPQRNGPRKSPALLMVGAQQPHQIGQEKQQRNTIRNCLRQKEINHNNTVLAQLPFLHLVVDECPAYPSFPTYNKEHFDCTNRIVILLFQVAAGSTIHKSATM